MKAIQLIRDSLLWYALAVTSLALVIGYVPEGTGGRAFAYYPFSGDISFTVLDGRVITPITATEAE